MDERQKDFIDAGRRQFLSVSSLLILPEKSIRLLSNDGSATGMRRRLIFDGSKLFRIFNDMLEIVLTHEKNVIRFSTK